MLEMNGSGCVVDRQSFFCKRSYLKNGSMPCLIHPIWSFHNVSSSVTVPSHTGISDGFWHIQPSSAACLAVLVAIPSKPSGPVTDSVDNLSVTALILSTESVFHAGHEPMMSDLYLVPSIRIGTNTGSSRAPDDLHCIFARISINTSFTKRKEDNSVACVEKCTHLTIYSQLSCHLPRSQHRYGRKS